MKKTILAISLLVLSSTASAGLIVDLMSTVENGNRELSARQQRNQNYWLTQDEQKRLTDDLSVKCIPWNMLQDLYFTNYKTCRLSGGAVQNVLDWETEKSKKNRKNNEKNKKAFANELNF